MEDFDKVVTFHTHYGELTFSRRYGKGCTLRPVPRSLSSSCGTAAYVNGDIAEEFIDDYVEGIYIKDGNGWKRIR